MCIIRLKAAMNYGLKQTMFKYQSDNIQNAQKGWNNRANDIVKVFTAVEMVSN